MGEEVLAVKEVDSQLPVPTSWRPIFNAMVAIMIERGVGPTKLPPQVREFDLQYNLDNVDAYEGSSLSALTQDTWDTSVAVWQGDDPRWGLCWEVLVDLPTVDEGRSDLVLHTTVREVAGDLEFSKNMVYVP